jgi:hypothetical protein
MLRRFISEPVALQFVRFSERNAATFTVAGQSAHLLQMQQQTEGVSPLFATILLARGWRVGYP